MHLAKYLRGPKWFNNLPIQVKLISTFAATIAILAMAMVFTNVRMQAIDAAGADANLDASSALQAAKLQTAFQEQVVQAKDLLLRGATDQSFQQYSANVSDAQAKVVDQRDALAKDVSQLNDAEAISALATFDQQYQYYLSEYAEAMNLVHGPTAYDNVTSDTVLNGKDQGAQQYMGTISRLWHGWSGSKGRACRNSATLGPTAATVSGLFGTVIVSRPPSAAGTEISGALA